MSKGQKALPGDWYCPGCNDLQFARNAECRRCGTPKNASAGGSVGKGGGARMGGAAGYGGCVGFEPVFFAPAEYGRGGFGPAMMKGGGCFGPPMMMACGGGGGGGRPGDWFCPSCGDVQYARNAVCRNCGTPKPAVGGIGMGGGMSSYGGCGGGMMDRMMGPAPAGKERPGDWYCTACGDLQFAKNASCRRCGQPKPDEREFARDRYTAMNGHGPGAYSGGGGGGSGGGTPRGGKPGDWICESCGDLQFARNTECRKCGAAPPGSGGREERVFEKVESFSGGGGRSTMRPGDWECAKCGDHVFARNASCRKCGAAKPDEREEMFDKAEVSRGKGKGAGKQMKPGDWHCPNCGDLQFARNIECRMCRTPKPEEGGSRSRSRSPRS
mmetsp:Transcript_9403/g.15180  ORF Transcript_9403/g.15180 Transcript_9403/m.15180 type:complete len:384 (+) Transcript_9403:53-1204(+)